MTTDDVLPFLRAWIKNPLQVAAITPSGTALADLITSEISPSSAPVLELGPGTGVFTRALLERGVSESDLTLIEYGSDFARRLDRQFPSARVMWMDAAQLGRPNLFDGAFFGAVISGLPLLSMPPKSIMAILAGAFAHMRPGASFYQFTYGPRCPVSRPLLDRLGLKATHIGRALLNVPPAAVYKISRRPRLRLLAAST
jgi:phospholipid N-methyltransferase